MHALNDFLLNISWKEWTCEKNESLIKIIKLSVPFYTIFKLMYESLSKRVSSHVC